MILNRRRFLTGLIAAPVVARAEFLMPVRSLWIGPTFNGVEIQLSDYIIEKFAKALEYDILHINSPGEICYLINGEPTLNNIKNEDKI